MITTASSEIESKTRSLRDHGASRTNLDRHGGDKGYLLPAFDDLGYNYRLTDIQAAVGVEQMRKADWILVDAPTSPPGTTPRCAPWVGSVRRSSRMDMSTATSRMSACSLRTSRRSQTSKRCTSAETS